MDLITFDFSLEIWGILICVVGLICSGLLTRAEPVALILMSMFGSVITTLVGGAIQDYARLMDTPSDFALTFVGNFFEYLGYPFVAATFAAYLTANVRRPAGSISKFRVAVDVACLLITIVLFMNIGTGWLYRVEGDDYFRGPVFPLFPLYLAAILLASLVYFVLHHRQFALMTRVTCFSCTLLMLFAAVATLFSPPVSINHVALVLCALFFTVNSQVVLKEKMRSKDMNIVEVRTKVALSQVQPHFLYNSLNTISCLCRTDPELAAKAVDRFSSYLRVNLDSLSRSEPISISKELEHVETYLWLEKQRFGDYLDFAIERHDDGFLVPVLVVQPIVENSVKHGLHPKEEGGRVIVRTWSDENAHYVEVSDDGVGFDVNAPFSADREHIGICSIKERLSVYGGRLDIQSKPGEGTVSLVRIPRGADYANHRC